MPSRTPNTSEGRRQSPKGKTMKLRAMTVIDLFLNFRFTTRINRFIAEFKAVEGNALDELYQLLTSQPDRVYQTCPLLPIHPPPSLTVRLLEVAKGGHQTAP